MVEENKPGEGVGKQKDDVDKLLDDLGLGEKGKPSTANVVGGKGSPADAKKAEFSQFDTPTGAKGQSHIDLLKDVTLNVKIELGRTKMFVGDILKLTGGSIVDLDKLTGDPLDLYVNDRLVARGEVLVINDNFAIRVIEIVTPESAEK